MLQVPTGRVVVVGIAIAVGAVGGCGRLGFGAASGDDDGGNARDLDAATSLDGNSLGCPAFAELCDGFESGDLSAWTETVRLAPHASVAATAAAARTGARGMAVDLPDTAGTTDDESVAWRPPAALTSGTIAVRAWVRPATPQIDFALVMTLKTDTMLYLGVGADTTGKWVVTEAAASDQFSTTATPVPGTWVCVELDFTFAGGGQARHTDLFLDDTKIIDGDSDGSTAAWDYVEVGIPRDGGGANHVDVDDVAIARQHIGCS